MTFVRIDTECVIRNGSDPSTLASIWLGRRRLQRKEEIADIICCIGLVKCLGACPEDLHFYAACSKNGSGFGPRLQATKLGNGLRVPRSRVRHSVAEEGSSSPQ